MPPVIFDDYVDITDMFARARRTMGHARLTAMPAAFAFAAAIDYMRRRYLRC